MELNSLHKALSAVNGTTSYHLENITDDVIIQPVAPRLLTALLSGETTDQFIETDTFKYDEIISTAVTMSSKRYDEYGNRINPDHSRRKIFEVGSHGASWNVRFEEVDGKVNPRTKKFYTVEERIQEKVNKGQVGWANYTEQAYAQLLMQDTNIGSTEHLEVYNFYTDIVGTARPTATNIPFSGGDEAAIREAINTESKRLDEALNKYDLVAQGKVVLCGSSAFADAWEEQAQYDLGRPLMGLDLASMGIPENEFGLNRFNVRYFDSETHGVRFIEVTGGIAGNLVSPTAMRMIPTGVSEGIFTRVYAPAKRFSTVNTIAQRSYEFSAQNDMGAVGATESNVLYANLRPELVRWMASA